MMDRRITVTQIADDLGLSKTTVSRALSGKGRIGKETVEKIRAYIEANSSEGHRTYSTSRHLQTRNIAVTLSGEGNDNLPFFQRCLLGISDVLSEHEYDIMITLLTPDHMENLRRVVDNHKVDGVILTRSLINDAPVKLLQDRKVPFVTIGSSEYPGVTQIDNDHFEACRELTSVLLGQGFHKIALIGGSSNHVITKTRYSGFVKAFHDAGVTLDTSIIYLDVSTDKRIASILSSIVDKEVDCLVCTDDKYAVRVIDICKSENISIPDDLRIASFYNSDLLSGLDPAITALDFNDRNLGAEAATCLLNKIKGEQAANKMLRTYEVLLRASTR